MRIKKSLLVLAAVFTVLFACLQYKVVAMQNAYTPVKSDCILILGHSLEDGSIPGSWLMKRLEKGLALYEEGYAEVLIVSGGKGPADRNAVAVSMKQWLVEQGVGGGRVLAEEDAGNTLENMSFTSEILKEKNFNSVIVVTNDFHMYRSMLIASRFMGQVTGASASVPLDAKKIAAYLKEPLSIMKYNLCDRIAFSG